MVLLFSKKTQTQLLLDFNVENLSKKMEHLSMDVYRSRNEDGFKIVKNLLNTCRNIQILEINRLKSSTTDQYAHMQGRLEALTDLSWHLDRCLDENYLDQIRKNQPAQNVRVLKKQKLGTDPVI
jgi:hypothetical protein